MTERDFPEDKDFKLHPLDKALEKMFGDAYLDSPDLSQKDIPEGLKEIAEKLDGDVANVSHLIGEAIERAPVWSCEEAQKKMIQHLEEYVTRDPDPKVGWLDGWAWLKHREQCCNHICAELDLILYLDKYLTPEEMKPKYEGFMREWFPKTIDRLDIINSLP